MRFYNHLIAVAIFLAQAILARLRLLCKVIYGTQSALRAGKDIFVGPDIQIVTELTQR